MEFVAHRGCADQHAENTVGALVRSARALGAVEVDVRRCGSGELVVFHDETVDRVTSATGAVADLSWAELRELEVLESGQSIPRLSTALAAVPAGVRVQVELKESGLAADARDVAADRDGPVSVSSFSPEILTEVDDAGWDVPTGLLFWSDPGANLRTALDLGCAAVHPHYDLCLETDVVAAAHEEGLRVVAWKAVETREEAAALRAAGVDAVTTDRWDVLAPTATASESTPERGSEPAP